MSNWKGGKLKRKCLACEKDIETHPSINKKFCNRKCFGDWVSKFFRGKNNPFYGRKHTKETIAKRTETIRKNGSLAGQKNPRYGYPPPASASRGVRSFYMSWLGKIYYLRSSYEKKYAEWLDSQRIYWDYEVKTFDLDSTATYTPDFFIYEDMSFKNLERLIEIKGFFNDRSKYKINRFRELYADIPLVVLTKNELNMHKGIRVR